MTHLRRRMKEDLRLRNCGWATSNVSRRSLDRLAADHYAVWPVTLSEFRQKAQGALAS
jgi:hypothetical protein